MVSKMFKKLSLPRLQKPHKNDDKTKAVARSAAMSLRCLISKNFGNQPQYILKSSFLLSLLKSILK